MEELEPISQVHLDRQEENPDRKRSTTFPDPENLGETKETRQRAAKLRAEERARAKVKASGRELHASRSVGQRTPESDEEPKGIDIWV